MSGLRLKLFNNLFLIIYTHRLYTTLMCSVQHINVFSIRL